MKKRKHLFLPSRERDPMSIVIKPRDVAQAIAIELHRIHRGLHSQELRHNTPREIWRMGVTLLDYEEFLFYNPGLHTHKIYWLQTSERDTPYDMRE